MANLAPAFALNADELVPIGHTTGIKLYSDGVIIAGTAKIDTESGQKSPSAQAGIKKGDVITKINGNTVKSNEDFRDTVLKNGSAPITLTISENGKERDVKINPVCGTDGKWRLGLFIRDSMAGIGTITFYDPKSNTFGALGHGICDTDTGVLIPFKSGSVMESKVSDIKRGATGSPGELHGDFNLNSDCGTLKGNTNAGIFGSFDENLSFLNKKALPVAKKEEVKIGPAVILSNVEGNNVEEYSIEILKIFPAENNETKNMLIKITDKKLISKTGGIVQGMSGSPIIQNGKLIGAVTHVLVNDPCKGYGIFIENMLKEE